MISPVAEGQRASRQANSGSGGVADEFRDKLEIVATNIASSAPEPTACPHCTTP